jgi:hypothetical protein
VPLCMSGAEFKSFLDMRELVLEPEYEFSFNVKLKHMEEHTCTSHHRVVACDVMRAPFASLNLKLTRKAGMALPRPTYSGLVFVAM